MRYVEDTFLVPAFKVVRYISIFFHFFSKENSCNFLFAYLENKNPSEKSLILKERICFNE